MFASRLNHQFIPYASWHLADPQARQIDAFTVDWSNHFIYVFPPFSVISRVLRQLELTQAREIVIVSNWQTQSWFPALTRLLIQCPLLFPRNVSNVHLPHNLKKQHPLGSKLQLMACLLSGNTYHVKEFQKQFKAPYSNPGDRAHKNNTKCISQNGSHILVSGKLIPFPLL